MNPTELPSKPDDRAALKKRKARDETAVLPWYRRPLEARESAALAYSGSSLRQLGLSRRVYDALTSAQKYRDVADLMLAEHDILSVHRIGDAALAEIDAVLAPLFDYMHRLGRTPPPSVTGDAGGTGAKAGVGAGESAEMRERWTAVLRVLNDNPALRDRTLYEAGWPLHLVALVQVDSVGDLAKIPHSRASEIWSLVAADPWSRDELLAAVERLAALPEDFSADAWADHLRSMGLTIVPEGYASSGTMDMKTALAAAVRQAVISTCRERDWSMLQLRFGLDGGGRRTLQAIGDMYGLTREGVRLILNKTMRYAQERLSDAGLRSVGQHLHPDVRESLATFEHLFGQIRLSPMRSDRVAAWCRDILGDDAEREDGDPEPIAELLARMHDVVIVSMDRARLQAVWVKDDKPKIAAVRKRVQGIHDVLLLNQIHGPMTDIELVEAVNARLGRSVRIGVEDVRDYAELCSAVEWLPDGRFEAREEILQVKLRIERILMAAGEPLHIAEIARRINLETAPGRRKTMDRVQASAQLSDNPRLVPLGRSGYWAHVDWTEYATETIADLIIKCLVEHDRPITQQEIYEWIVDRRPVGETSIIAYLRMDSRFVLLNDQTWSLADWIEPRGYIVAPPRRKRRADPREDRLRRLAATVLAGRPNATMPLAELRAMVVAELGYSQSSATYRMAKMPELEIFSTGSKRAYSVRWRGPLPPEE